MQYAVHVSTGMTHDVARVHWASTAAENDMTPVGEPTVMRQGPVLRLEGEVHARVSA